MLSERELISLRKILLHSSEPRYKCYITITGSEFGSKKFLQNPSKVQKKICKVKSWGMGSITFIVPKTSTSFAPGSYSLKVENKIGVAVSPSDFSVD
jgi:hypothetical protein